jgi:dTMP kinase
MNNLGKFITLEGVDGAGKTTHVEFIKKYLSDLGVNFVMTREPGGTLLGEQLREILLHDEMSPETETLLMFAARNEHIEKVIRPNLTEGKVVISDRFTDATYAYQSGGKGVKEKKIDILKEWVQASLQPDLTFLFDLSVEVSIERLNKTRRAG